MNLLDQTLANRAQRVLKNTGGESNCTLGREISSAQTDRPVGSGSSSNLDGTGEGDCCLVIVGTAMTRDPMEALGGHLCRRGGPPMERIDTALSHFSITQFNCWGKYSTWDVHQVVILLPSLPLAPLTLRPSCIRGATGGIHRNHGSPCRIGQSQHVTVITFKDGPLSEQPVGAN